MPRPPKMLLFGEELRLRPAIRVAACSGVHTTVIADPAHIVKATADLEPDLVLFHYDHAGPAARLLIDEVAQRCTGAELIILAHPSPPDDIGSLLAEPWLTHLHALESPYFMDELGTTLAKLRGREIFGLASYLPWGTRVISERVTSSDDKVAIFERVHEFMLAIGVGGRIVRRLQTVADEMLMNAVYDAPLDSDGQPRYASLSRQARITLDPSEQPLLAFGSDGRTFGISITDPFGGLSPATLKRYIAKGLRRGADQMDRKEGGAGLGLYLLFESLHSMILNVAPGRWTELIGLVDIRGSFRDMVTTPKSFNLFVREG